MNLKEVKKVVYVDILIICFTVICFVFSLLYLIFGDINVKAQTIDMKDYSYSSGSFTTNDKYLAARNSGPSFTYETLGIGNGYTGKMYYFQVYFNYNFQANTKYTLTLEMMDNDWRNTINSRTLYDRSHSKTIAHSYTFISKKKIQLVFTPTQATSNTYLELTNSSYTTAITGDTSFCLLRISLTFTGVDEQIIANQNQNTQDIIDNINNGIEDVSSNLNSNFQDTITAIDSGIISVTGEIADMRDSLLGGCMLGPTALDTDLYDFVKGSLDADGNVNSSNTSYRVSPFLYIRPGHIYTINVGQSRTVPYFCFYYGNKGKIECTNYNNIREFNVVAPNNAVYLRVTAISSGGQIIPPTITGPLCNNWSLEKENAINNYLQDNSDPSINNNDISNALESVQIDDPLNYLLTLPIHAIERINYQLGRNSCSPINLGAFLGTDLILPCVNVEQSIGTTLFNTMDILIAIGIGAVTLKKFYDSVSNVLTLGKEKEVREKLELPTPMEFFAMIFGGGR